MAKQSGPLGRVKGATACATLALCSALIACTPSTRWVQQGRTAAATAADLSTCESNAERATLTARGQTRGAYGADNAPGVAGGRSGRSPMDLHDRTDDANDFRDAVARCMSGLGYSDSRAPVTNRRR